MRLFREYFYNGIVRLAPNEFLVATRTLKPDNRIVPLYDLFGPPLWLGRMRCSDDEIKRLTNLRDQQLEEAESALMGGAISMVSCAQRLMRRSLEPMLYFTDYSILNPGNSTVIMRTRALPDMLASDLEHFAAYPIPRKNSLSAMVLYRPRSYGGARELPGFSINSDSTTTVMEVTGFQIGREGLVGNGVKSLMFPRFRHRNVQICKTSVA